MSNTLAHNNYKTDQIRNPLLLAEHFLKSKFFKDTTDISQTLVKIVAGQELGFGPMASITGFHIVQGKPTISANLMGAAIKRSGRYNYKVVEMTEQVCSIDFYEEKEFCGNSIFTIEQARKAETKNLQKYPRNMLFARALSNGARWYCPDVLNGSPIYTPEELGAEVDQDGEVVAIPESTQNSESETDKIARNFIGRLENNNADLDLERTRIWLLDNQNKISTIYFEKATNLIMKKENEEKTIDIEPNLTETENIEEEVENFTKPIEEIQTA